MTDINFTDFWSPLFYGNASWIGLIVIAALLIFIAGIWKYGFVFSVPVAWLLALNYWASAGTYSNPDLMWNGIIIFALGCVLLIAGAENIK